MAGWYTENGTSVSATERLRAALPNLRRSAATVPDTAPEPEQGLREDRLRLVNDYVGEYPQDDAERRECNRALHEPDEQPLEQAS
jgi:hypothetical protein